MDRARVLNEVAALAETTCEVSSMTREVSLRAVALRIAQARVRAAKYLAATVVGLMLLAQPAAAQEVEECGGQISAFENLFQLLTELERLGIALGLSIAVLGYISAGVCWQIPGQEWTMRGKRIFASTTVGLAIVLMSGGFIQFIQDVLCGG